MIQCAPETLVASDVSGTPPIDANEFAGVFDVYLELICARAARSIAEKQK